VAYRLGPRAKDDFEKQDFKMQYFHMSISKIQDF